VGVVLLMASWPVTDIADFQRQLDAIAEHCDLHRYHHRLEALSATEAAINPRPMFAHSRRLNTESGVSALNSRRCRASPCMVMRADQPDDRFRPRASHTVSQALGALPL
jgi:hypothetical protein